MSDIRYDPVFDTWSAIAENRRDRPIEFVPVEQGFKQLICPFCSGNEEETPPALLALGLDGRTVANDLGGCWSARVIPNKYPTYFESEQSDTSFAGPYQRSTAVGDQELIIPTSRHVLSLSELEREELTVALQAAQYRIADKQKQDRIEHTMFFGNCRFEAGASVAHIHFQMIGSPIVSSNLLARSMRFAEAHQTGQTLLEQVLKFELDSRVRLIAETDDFVMICPFASRFAFQVWIIPRAPLPSFWEINRLQLDQLGRLSQRYLERIEVLLSEPAYNWMLHLLPFNNSIHDHWFVEIVPRIAKTAGYEMGTDIWINPVAPEVAARRLRS